MDTIISKPKHEEPVQKDDSRKIVEQTPEEDSKKETKKEVEKQTGSQARAGHNNTQTVLTAAGASMIGSASGSAGAMAYADELRPHHLDYDDLDEEEEEEEGNGEEGGEPEGGEPEGGEPEGGEPEGGEPEGGEPEGGEPNSGEGEEIEPLDNGEGNDGGEIDPDEWEEGGEPEGGEPEGGDITENEENDIDNVLPDEIAQELASEVDADDRDMNSAFDVTSIETRYDQEGNEMQVAMLQTADGGQFMMVDVDNDFTFDVVTDMAGNPVAQVEGGLTMSDVQEMLDDSGGYLTSDEEVSLASNDISEVDVINTDGTGSDLAALDATDYEQGLDPLLEDGFEYIDPTDIDSDIYDA